MIYNIPFASLNSVKHMRECMNISIKYIELNFYGILIKKVNKE